MAVTLTSADKALKSYYLDAISEQLNHVSPFFAKIEQSTDDVWGKEVKRLVPYGVNGGIGAGTEDGNLPTAAGNKYGQISVGLKNLYGTIEISDKAIRASENNSGAFISLLNSEMEGLIRASKLNFGRMLFGNGQGCLGEVTGITSGKIALDTVKNVFEGMIIDFRDDNNLAINTAKGRTVESVDRVNKTITVSGTTLTTTTVPIGSTILMQGSYQNELTGLGAIFDTSSNLYGLARQTNPWLNPYVKSSVGTLTENAIQEAIDTVEEKGGAPVNFIVCSTGVRRALYNVLSTNRGTVNSMELQGGFTAMSFNGIPVVADRFCPNGQMYLLNTDDFTLHQLCDWQWLSDDDGRILKQVAGKPVYTATLVKYAELVCARPYGQGLLKGITEA